MKRERLEALLQATGYLLSKSGDSVGLVIVGGAVLLLRGVVDRPTRDVDAIAEVTDSQIKERQELAPEVLDVVKAVADLFEADSDWLNLKAAGLLRFGMPEGWQDRLEVRRYGALTLYLVGRHELICTKLYALVDQGPTSKHARDLLALDPTDEELRQATAWARTHDPSPGFAQMAEEVLRWIPTQRN